ncbi:hypothetical protein G6F56_004424 [Rhizopus delemar]|nr:hypothetical protein G6F56_004424 [Rhizopus delemar]
MKNINTQAPPPTYQQSGNAGQTYYEPPPPPAENANYAPPPTQPPQGTAMGQRFQHFYAPPQNRRLGLMRRFCSVICCCIIIGLIVGLAAGLTRRSYGYGSRCTCRTNSDCTYRYGPGTYCYSGCQCTRY